MTHQDLELLAHKAILEKRVSPFSKLSPFTSCQQAAESAEWWEQFGDCYDYWPPLPDSEFDYLTNKSTYPVK